MTIKFRRMVRVQVDTLRFTELAASFDITKTINAAPNKASVKVYNLSRNSRRQIEELSARRGRGRIRTVVETAYGTDAFSIIFAGDLRTATSEHEGGNTWITTLEGEDAGRAHMWSRVNLSFPPGASVYQVARAAALAMGVGLGNFDDAMAGASFTDGSSTYPAGTVLSGSAPEEFAGVLRSVGFTFSVQDNVLQVLRRGHAIQRTAVLLTPDTGLISAQKQVDGTVKLKCLIDPDIYPARQLQVRSEALSGNFKAKKCQYKGETFGNDWYCEIEAEELFTVG